MFSLNTFIEQISIYPNMGRGNKRLIILLGLFGDFDSFEYVQVINAHLNQIESSNIELLVIGIGNEPALTKFC